MPGARRNCQKYLPLMPAAIRRLDLSGYKLIVSSESGPIKGVRKPKEALHVCYCHTPMRYLWDMYEDYYRTTGPAGKAAMRIFRDYLRRYDLASAGSVDAFIANSGFVADRIRRIYGRESTVIYPPVESGFFREAAGSPKEDYYLFVGQLIGLQAARSGDRGLPETGAAADSGRGRRYARRTRSTIRERDRIRRRPGLQELRRLYARARALLFPGVEDFGIVPLEAQAAGTPVIALGQGGALETVADGRTGLFFARPETDLLCEAIERFEAQNFDTAVLVANAERFAPERFRREISSFVASL